jgi:hypothetical protein
MITGISGYQTQAIERHRDAQKGPGLQRERYGGVRIALCNHAYLRPPRRSQVNPTCAPVNGTAH